MARGHPRQARPSAEMTTKAGSRARADRRQRMSAGTSEVSVSSLRAEATLVLPAAGCVDPLACRSLGTPIGVGAAKVCK